jgi:DNA processing protein
MAGEPAFTPGGAVDVAASLTLAHLPGVGAVGYARLTGTFGSAADVLGAGVRRLREEATVAEPLARAIAAARLDGQARRYLAWAERAGVRILPLEDAAYPRLLKEIADPPPILYVKGDGLAAAGRAVAVVGSRWITPYGRRVTASLARAFAQAGITVVSGMALGVDGQAHRSALEAGGNTVAVLGVGLDRPYPPEHGKLFAQIAEQGAVVSEFPPGTRPLGAHFPRRNRVISGLSLGVVVVEARKGSGSLITARLANDQGREVFAVPGDVHQPGSAGTHALIREGARLITGAGDVIEELLPQLVVRAPADTGAAWGIPEDLPDAERRILGELGSVPVAADVLVDRIGTPAPEVLNTLLEMELKGLVEKQPGNRYIRLLPDR